MATKYSIIDHCDTLWRDLIILRDGGACVKCGTIHILQAHHLISRTYWSLRHEPDNGLCMCRNCHIFWIRQYPLDYARWLEREYPGLYDKLKLRKHQKPKHDYTLVRMFLEGEIKKLEGR